MNLFAGGVGGGDAPLLGVSRLRLVAALERLENATRETADVAFNFVPIGEDAVGSADGVVFLRLSLLLLPLGRFALGLFDRRSGRQSVCRFPRLPRHPEQLLSLGSLDQRPSSRQHLGRRLRDFVSLRSMGFA
jgi:hypothetical protein